MCSYVKLLFFSSLKIAISNVPVQDQLTQILKYDKITQFLKIKKNL